MPFSLTLTDLVAPYLLKGQDVNGWHAALSILRVVSYHAAGDGFGTVIRGTLEVQGKLDIPGPGGTLFQFSNDESDPPFDPSRRSPVFDLNETSIGFELHVPRVASNVIAAGAAALAANAGFAPVQALLADWDAVPNDAPPSDYPPSAFTVDLIVNAPTFRPGGLTPAQLTPDGLLVPDRSGPQEVVFTLPKLRVRITHDRAGDGLLRVALASFGSPSLDDPADTEVVEAVSMVPPYALIDGDVGFGFRGAVLDLSNDQTPADVRDRIGVGDDWQGLYFPELRLFVPASGLGLAFDFSAEHFMWGFPPTAGISGDFGASLFNTGADRPLRVGARFFDERGRSLGTLEREGPNRNAVLPAVTRMVVDVEGGRVPYAVTVRIGNAAAATGRVFAIDLSAVPTLTIAIEVDDAGVGPMRKHAALTIVARRGDPRVVLVQPGTPAGPVKEATLQAAAGADPKLYIQSQNDRWVTVGTQPPDPRVRWTVDAEPETAPRPAVAVQVLPGQTRQVKASVPAVPAQALRVYYYFDHPPTPGAGNAADQARDAVQATDLAWTTLAKGRLPSSGREPGGRRPFTTDADMDLVRAARQAGADLRITGEASFEGDESKDRHNYPLARRRALAAHGLLVQEMKRKDETPFAPDKTVLLPAYDNFQDDPNLSTWKAQWMTRPDAGGRQWWRADVTFDPPQQSAARQSQATLQRPAVAPGTPGQIVVLDPPAPNPPARPDWFRSASVKVRFVEGALIAIQLDGEIDLQTCAEEKLRSTGQVPGNQAPGDIRTLANGRPLAPDNPGDGIVAFRFLYQRDDATNRKVVSLSLGADPSDTDGLAAVGWIPGEARAPRDFWRNLLGSYVSFWPLLVNAAERDLGAPVDAAIAVAEMAIPAVVAALPWFTVERVILHGAEYLARWRPAGSEGNLFLDVEAAWSVSLPDQNAPLIWIDPNAPLSVRYKAIGLRLADFEDDGTPIAPRYDFRPVFDSSRGYAIGVDKSGAIQVRPPFDRILRILAARLSRTNPLTFEIDVGMGVDLGVVTFERLGVRARMDGSGHVEITAMAATVDIPGALVGRGYLEIRDPEFKGQIDLTVRPIGLRVSGSLAISDIPAAQGGPATGLFVGLDLLLPFGIPLGNSGLGLFGFRGLFGMHYARTPIGADKAVPSLEWLKAAKGRPNLLESDNVALWEPKIDRWSFGVGTVVGTMEGGVLFNLDGTLLLELPGPNVIVAANARFLTPPPSMDQAGGVGGILGVIEIAPNFIAIGIYATYEIKKLIEIRVPAEAYFAKSSLSDWHFYLGSRTDIAKGPGPIRVRVLNIVDGTGYLMVRGEGLPAYTPLPPVSGFAVGVGAGASFIWGDVDLGLYAKLGGSLDAVAGFDPLIVAATLKVFGELRLFVASVGADASLTVTVREQRAPGPRPALPYVPDLSVRVHGQVCGHIDLWFFEVSDCVSISFGTEGNEPPVPPLVDRVSLRSRSPALAQGSGVDRPIDASLGEAAPGDNAPAALPVVPIDAVPVATMLASPAVDKDAKFLGTALAPPPNAGPQPVDRGGVKYGYALKGVTLERIAGDGSVMSKTLFDGPAPARWWTRQGAAGDPTNAHLALLTWELDPAPRAIETSDQLTTTVQERWGTVCHRAADPASVLWTFRFEPLGPSAPGWRLAGIAWPDPPGTKRSAPADAELVVFETWRSGVMWVDAARGVIPAVVVGGPVPCRRVSRDASVLADTVRVDGRGPVDARAAQDGRGGYALASADPVLQRLVTGDAMRPFRVPGALVEKVRAAEAFAPPRDAAAVLNALASGTDLSRADAAGVLTPLPSQPARRGAACEARVLQGPLMDDGTLRRFGDPARDDAIARELQQRGLRHGPLDDVVVLETGPFELLRLLMFVTPIHARTVCVRVLSKDGTELERRTVTMADATPPRPLPPSWTDVTGPWAGDVADVLAFLSGQPRLGRYAVVLLELGSHRDAARVEIGVEPSAGGDAAWLLPYYVGAIELLRLAERLRHDFDEQSVEREHKTVTEFLGAGSDEHALMHPNSLYRLSLQWSGNRESAAAQDHTQRFWFKTDDQPPPRLDPFVLMTAPCERETHVFRGEPLRLVFNGTGVEALWSAYGRSLKVRIQAASGKHPPGQWPSSPAVQFALPKEAFEPAGAHVLTPFEDALVQTVSTLPCIAVDGSRRRQDTVTIPIPLRPYTDYLLDIVAVGANENVTADTPFILRRRFSTGAFETLSAFAASVGSVRIVHAAIVAGTAAGLATFATRAPQGQELDDALRACGLDVDGAPREPAATVLWEPGAGVPQPVAVLLDAQEPLWRRRATPEKIADPDGLPGTQRWKLTEQVWLDLVPAAGSEALVSAPPAEAPGGQRALVLLAAGARGQRLQLELRRKAFPEPYLAVAEERRLVVDVRLDRAPWEE